MEYKAEPHPTSSQQYRPHFPHSDTTLTYCGHNDVYQTHPRSLSRRPRSRRSTHPASSGEQPRRYVLLESTPTC